MLTMKRKPYMRLSYFARFMTKIKEKMLRRAGKTLL
jgi:hypothetical protein